MGKAKKNWSPSSTNLAKVCGIKYNKNCQVIRLKFLCVILSVA